jgi:predicted AlkP superfamily pyrophosphatase or phosphodiesterase
MRFALLSCIGLLASAQNQKLVVISVDGLDQRYLRDADKLGLKIPTLRKLIREGEWSQGVEGVVPTVTWPSHTTLITGVPPREHGILGNRRPRSESGDYYWMASMLRAKTLWHSTRQAGLKSAAITWPVTVNADIDYNFPEFFRGRNGGSMDYTSIWEYSTPGLIEKLERFDPSVRQQWFDDRVRKVATVYLLQNERPDLLLLHFVDVDAVAHDHGPFTKEANAALEQTDAYIAEILAAAPKNTVIALVSDHGFERVDRELSVPILDMELDLKGKVQSHGGLLFALSPDATQKLAKSDYVGRRVPREEILKFAPDMNRKEIFAAFEPKRHEAFLGMPGLKSLSNPPHEIGNHGFWPGLSDYRSVFLLWGPGIRARQLPAMRMESIAPRLAQILGVPLPLDNTASDR